MAWAFLDLPHPAARSAERRALEARVRTNLARQVLAPGSPLACLDALVGENVEAACEKALFVSPVNVAAASSYVAARLTLLARMTAYAERGGADIEPVLVPLRRSLEADHFGFVAHVLTVRDGVHEPELQDACAAARSEPGAIQSRARRPLIAISTTIRTFGRRRPTAHPRRSPKRSRMRPGPHKLVNIDFPSAASIPAVSIMNPEPTGPVLPGVAAAAAANPNSQAAAPASRRSRKQAANPPAPTVVQPAPTGSAAAEPIWPEPVPPPPPQTAAAPAGAPVQLNPPSPSASAGRAGAGAMS